MNKFFIVQQKNILFLLFFLLGKKEPKTQDERPISILFSRKNLRNTTEKIVIRSLSPKATAPLLTYDKFATK
jgi:hypothetical protein